MQPVKISLINGDLSTIPCSIAFLKHIQGLMSAPESAIDSKLGGQLTALYKEHEKQRYISLETADALTCQSLYILNFHEDDLPFTYTSLDSYARRIIRYGLKISGATSVATAMHGPGSGLDASEAMETLLSALYREFSLRGGFGGLREIKLVEKDKNVFNRLRDRISYILDNKEFIIREGQDIFLNPQNEERSTDSDAERTQKLLRHAFVAMPYAKEFDNVYYFGMKGPVERHKLKCERVDQDNFTGDIVARIKERIASAEFVIADITGNKPNVFFEVGYAEGLKKKVVYISQQRDVPFDVGTQRQIFYDPQDILALTNELEELLDSILANE